MAPEITPGERFVHMIETMFGLARLGYTNRDLHNDGIESPDRTDGPPSPPFDRIPERCRRLCPRTPDS